MSVEGTGTFRTSEAMITDFKAKFGDKSWSHMLSGECVSHSTAIALALRQLLATGMVIGYKEDGIFWRLSEPIQIEQVKVVAKYTRRYYIEPQSDKELQTLLHSSSIVDEEKVAVDNLIDLNAPHHSIISVAVHDNSGNTKRLAIDSTALQYDIVFTSSATFSFPIHLFLVPVDLFSKNIIHTYFEHTLTDHETNPQALLLNFIGEVWINHQSSTHSKSTIELVNCLLNHAKSLVFGSKKN